METREGPAGACSSSRQSWSSSESVPRARKQEPPSGKERQRATDTCSLLSSGLRSRPILFDFECLRIVLEGNTDSFFMIFGGVERTGLLFWTGSSPSVWYYGQLQGRDKGCVSSLVLWAPQAMSDITLRSSGVSVNHMYLQQGC